MNGVLFGQYIPGPSVIHSLDPRTKLYMAAALLGAVIGADTLPGVTITACGVALLVLLARAPVKLYWNGTRPLLVIIVITAAFQVFLVPGQVLYRWWFLTITDTGILMAALMTYRLIMVYLLAQLLTFTTSPLQLTNGLERILKPFRKVGVPAHELAMIMTIALRFIPVLFEESDKITKAQISRGADFQGGWLKSARNLAAIMAPLFIRAFRRADELALAMEARCYAGGEGRTSLHAMIMSRSDYAAIAVTTGLVMVVIGAGM